MIDRTPRLFASALTLALATALTVGAAAQDRPAKTQPKKAQPAKEAKKRRPRKAPAKVTTPRSKKQRDAADDALFGGDETKKAPKRPRPPVSTDGPWPAENDSPWPAENDSPWPAEDTIDAEEEDELFGDLDEDMQSPSDKAEAEERGSTHAPTRTHHHHPAPATPSPDASDWRVTPQTPEMLEWNEGSDIPSGYVKSSRVNRGLVIAGAVTLGVSWMATAAYGSYLVQERDPGFWEEQNSEDAPAEAVLYIPLVGPWIALGTVDHGARERAAFIAGGVVQAGGLAMLIGGLAARHTVLVKKDDVEVGVAPTGNGLQLNGSF